MSHKDRLIDYLTQQLWLDRDIDQPRALQNIIYFQVYTMGLGLESIGETSASLIGPDTGTFFYIGLQHQKEWHNQAVVCLVYIE